MSPKKNVVSEIAFWRKRPFLFLAVIVWIVVAGLFAWRRSTSNSRMRDLSGGAVAQRARIDRFIDSTAEMTVDDAIASLQVHSEGFGLAQLASSSPDSLFNTFIRQVIADRRAAKIFEAFDSLPRSESSDKSSEVYDSAFATLESGWDDFAAGKIPFTELVPMHHAASVGLFLCACFEDTDELVAKIDKWESVMGNQNYDSIPGVEYIPHYRFPDPLFTVNLVVISGERNGGELSRLRVLLEQFASGRSNPNLVRLEELHFFKWDALTNNTDFTHITRGVPVNANDIMATFPGFVQKYPEESKPEFCRKLRQQVSQWALER